MRYAILVYETEHDFANREQHMPAYRAYSQALAEAGIMVGGAELHPSHTGTTLRLQNGQRQVQDGPYADTKEQLGGFFLIDVADLDAALDWAARCPAASNCAVEVRPLAPANPA
ncbi:YciI family protein [Nodosilinea sp. LEGE 07088]|uniref:YciI family protein n=1 Tax=Nodosilinea sp. LEGE 07088 TaxID=2777968 RepID=UPI00187E2783|nr:YciI family protein [Nodosilinea sp. LEGE 07088]MBE9140180.1 YciI family protein [Nodosilinea sp. LEGE 07088]